MAVNELRPKAPKRASSVLRVRIPKDDPDQTTKLAAVFSKLAHQWRRETSLSSFMETMAMHPAYQRIIGMGPAALPLILQEMTRKPDHWFWALAAITGENPVPPEDAGNLSKMTEDWLQLGRTRGWI